MPEKTQAEIVIKKQSQMKEIMGRFAKNKMAILSLGVIVLLILMAIFAEQIAPYGPDDTPPIKIPMIN